MSAVTEAVQNIEELFSTAQYPNAFLQKYDQMECLASHRGLETFLVQDKKTKGQFVAKCYDKSVYAVAQETEILQSLRHEGLPAFIDEFQNDRMLCIVREYIEGTPLNQYAMENELSREQIIALCVKLSDVLIYLHEQEPPVIHRDVKPQNVIIRENGEPVLIDFDAARTFKSDADTDTHFLGTKSYAPPEQFGFTQTDCRADIYSFGVLLRFLLTDSVRENPNVRLYKPLARVIARCTAFSPKERFADMRAVKKALLNATPKAQLLRTARVAACVLAASALLTLGGVKLYSYIAAGFVTEGNIPAALSDEERIKDAVAYMKQKYGTDLFADTESPATIGLARAALTEVYGYDADYVYAAPTEGGMPHESEHNFLPWAVGDEQHLLRMTMSYIAVKIYWVDKVSDYSSLQDDNGFYPGARVADAFCKENGILTGVTRLEDITTGEAALILANADRVYEATKEQAN